MELARDLGDASKPRAWSKYASDSSAFKTKQKDSEAGIEEKGKDKDRKKKSGTKTNKVDELLGEVWHTTRSAWDMLPVYVQVHLHNNKTIMYNIFPDGREPVMMIQTYADILCIVVQMFVSGQ